LIVLPFGQPPLFCKPRNISAKFLLIAALTITVSSPFALGQTKTETPAQPSTATITRDQAEAILQELKLIRAALEKNPPAPQRVTNQKRTLPEEVNISDSRERSLGRADAPLVLVEFTDYECPFCKRFHQETFAKLKSEFIDTGKVRFVSHDLPLSFHANAGRAAEAARCAADQGKFWEMRESLASAQDLSASSLASQGKQIGLDNDAFQKCTETEKYQKAVRDEAVEANSMSIVATPSFVLGRVMPDGKINGKLVVGAMPLPSFEALIREQLGEREKKGANENP
jgi:protein-disulfide isomerase